MAHGPRRGGFLAQLAAEFLIIVVGVLVAFQFDAWRDRQVSRDREQEQLLALEIDFEANARELQATLRAQRRALTAVGDLLDQYGPTPPRISVDSTATLLVYALSWYAVETVSGAYDALLASGDIGIIRDHDLRRQLAEFYGRLDAGFEDHENEMDILALMIDSSSRQLRPLVDTGNWRDRGPFRASGADPAAVRGLLANDSFAGLLTWKLLLASNREFWLSDLAARTDSILSRIGNDAAPVLED